MGMCLAMGVLVRITGYFLKFFLSTKVGFGVVFKLIQYVDQLLEGTSNNALFWRS